MIPNWNQFILFRFYFLIYPESALQRPWWFRAAQPMDPLAFWPLGAPSPWAHWLDARALGLIDPWAQGPMGSCGEGLGIIVFRTNLLPWHHDVLTCPTKREGGQKIKQTKSGCYKEDPGQADRQSQVSKVLPTPYTGKIQCNHQE